ncbi:MAG: hypothetical protein OET57_15240 [Desulfobacteraceae bacterium]|nr:hypothetical protein [Desulfobacteraceae bacterium]MDH3722328.1 hypothetical protein [Desulfobacteraceae bacterium]MDH3838099.1 hypothetical protein [Desulfobacteraceae bacterium]
MCHTNKKWFGYAIRWIPRVVGTLLFVMLIVFAIGEGVPNPIEQSLVVQIEMLAMFIMWFGLLIAWKSELIGGMLVLLGYTCFCGVEWQTPSIKFPFGLFLFVGLLYMFSWWSRKKQNSGT